MTVCRYFTQGYCRYGDKCRFEHIETNYNKQSYNSNQYNTGNYEDRYGSNYNRYDNEYRNQRYDSRNFYNDDHRSYVSDKYNARSSGQYNPQQYRNRQGYEQNFGRKQNQQSYEYENENVCGQNRYKWLSDDYKNQAQLSVAHDDYEYGNDSYTTSTPKGKPSFSFKVPESEVKKGSSNFFQVDEQDQMLTDKVQEDAKSWEYGGQWPFSCYFPFPNQCAFPGFYDVSPEELRLAAYEAEKTNSSAIYVQGVQNALNQINQQRSELQVATPQLVNTLRKIRSGEDLYSSSPKINPIASGVSGDNVLEIMEMPDISSAANNAAASFSFKTPTAVSNAAASFSFKTPAAENYAAASFSFKVPSETDSAAKTSVSSFSFKLPSASETKPVITTASDGDVNIYTPFGSLTEEEKEQFSASTFVLGKIPTRPPSLVFCN